MGMGEAPGSRDAPGDAEATGETIGDAETAAAGADGGADAWRTAAAPPPLGGGLALGRDPARLNTKAAVATTNRRTRNATSALEDATPPTDGVAGVNAGRVTGTPDVGVWAS
jgi:hypothetical protein